MAYSQGQLRNAQTILRVGSRMGAPRKVLKAALEAGLVESNLRNLRYGDRDSLGVFQQRPSQGWGSAGQVLNVRHAARSFFKRAIPLAHRYGRAGDLAQAVQRSAFPGRYQQQSGLADRLLGGLGASGIGVGGTNGSRGPLRLGAVSPASTAFLDVLNQQAARPLPPVSAPPVPSFSAGPSLPQGYRAPQSTFQPAAKQSPLAEKLAALAQLQAPELPSVQGGVAASGGTVAGAVPRGRVRIAPGANRSGVPIKPVVLRFVSGIAGLHRTPVTIGTGSNHSQMTVDGNVSDHWDGHAADIPVPVDSKRGDRLAMRALELAGVPAGRAARMAREGGLFTLNPESGPFKGHRVQVIWKTDAGGNHHGHLHVGIR